MLGERVHAHEATRLTTGAANAGGGHDRVLVHGVDVLRRLDADDARVGRHGEPFELDREIDLGFGREAEQRGVEQLEQRRLDVVRFRDTGVLVEGPELRVVARIGEGLGKHRHVERARPRETLLAVDDDAHADTARLGR